MAPQGRSKSAGWLGGWLEEVEEIARLAHAAAKDETGKMPTTLALASAPQLSRQLSRSGGGGFGGGLRGAERAKEIVKEGLSEYFLYTVEGRDAIPTDASRRGATAENRPVGSLYSGAFSQEPCLIRWNRCETICRNRW